MTDPAVSIVIPCYNGEKYIGEAIQSALAQTYPSVEVIVIDDGSTDGCLDVIRSFGDAVRWETGPNRGACAARNRGIELARGELIQFLDADDLLLPRKLERQVRELGTSGADLVFCDGDAREFDKVTRRFTRRLNGGDPVQYVLAGWLPTPAGLHYRKNLLAVGGFREDLPCAQERDLHLRLACAGLHFHHLPELLYTVRRVPGSVSSDSLKVLDQHAAIVQRAVAQLREMGTLTSPRARALAGLLALDARAYLRHGRPDRAVAYFELARAIEPDGGLTWAYQRPARVLLKVLGPRWTERLVSLKRTFATGGTTAERGTTPALEIEP